MKLFKSILLIFVLSLLSVSNVFSQNQTLQVDVNGNFVNPRGYKLSANNIANNSSILPTNATYDINGEYFVPVSRTSTYYITPGPNASEDWGVFWGNNYEFSATGPVTIDSTITNIILIFDDENANASVESTVTIVTNNYAGNFGGNFAGNILEGSTVPASTIVGSIIVSQLIGGPYPLISMAALGTSTQPMIMTAVPPNLVKAPSFNFGLVIGSPTPFASSCGGIVIPMFSTNSHMHGYAGTFYTNASDGTPIYLIDVNAGQINAVGEQYTATGDINAGTIGTFTDPTWQFIMGTFCNANNNSGGECDYFIDDVQTNSTVHWPGVNQPNVTSADPRLAIGGLGSWDAGSYNIARRQLTGWFLTCGTTNMNTTNIFQANIPNPTNGNVTLLTDVASIGTNGVVYANKGIVSTTNTIIPLVMTPNTTATVTYNASGYNETVYDTSGSTITSLSITLPSVTIPGQILRYVTAGIATTVTVTGTVSIGSALTSLAANGSVAYQSINTTGTFIRLY